MYEITMLLAFFYAATCQLFPRTYRGDKPDWLRKMRIEGKARKSAQKSVAKHTSCQEKPVRGNDRKPALHIRHDKLRQVSEKADGTRRNRINQR